MTISVVLVYQFVNSLQSPDLQIEIHRNDSQSLWPWYVCLRELYYRACGRLWRVCAGAFKKAGAIVLEDSVVEVDEKAANSKVLVAGND